MGTMCFVAATIRLNSWLYSNCKSIKQQCIVLGMYDATIALLLLYTVFESKVMSYI